MEQPNPASPARVVGGLPERARRVPAPKDTVALFALLHPLVAAVEGCRLEAVRGDEGWWCRPGAAPEAVVAAAVPPVVAPDAEISLPGTAWAGAFALQLGAGQGRLMVVSAERVPRPSRLLRLRLIAMRMRTMAVCHAAATICDDAVRLVEGVRSAAAEGDGLRVLHLAQQRVIAAVGDGSGMAGVARALSETAGRPVAVWDHGGRQVVAVGPDGAPGADAPEPGLPSPLVERRAFRSDGWVCCAVRAGDGRLAIVGLFDPDGTVGDVGAIVLEDVAAVSALETLLVGRGPGTTSRMRAELADALLRDEEPARVRARAAALGHDLERPHQVILVHGDPPARLADAAGWTAHAQHPAVLATSHGAGAVLVTACRMDWDGLVADLEARLGHRRFVVATSGWSDRGDTLGGALREAEAALRLAGAVGSGRVVHYDDLGLFQILAAQGDPTELRRYVDRWLGALVDYDARRGTELVRTLSEYLERGGTVEGAAEALVIHRSTLKYRLARVSELTGLDLGDPDTRFHLQLATRARTTLAAFGGTRGG